jgi:hypothetical protein
MLERLAGIRSDIGIGSEKVVFLIMNSQWYRGDGRIIAGS